MSGELLATRRRELAEAEAAAAEAASAAAGIRHRILCVDDAMTEITARRLRGDAPPGASAEYAALVGDRAALIDALGAAEARCIAADSKPARQALAAAEADHQREQDEVAFTALQQRLLALDAALVRCIAEAASIGRRIGRDRLSAVYRGSDALKRVLIHGVAPMVSSERRE